MKKILSFALLFLFSPLSFAISADIEQRNQTVLEIMKCNYAAHILKYEEKSKKASKYLDKYIAEKYYKGHEELRGSRYGPLTSEDFNYKLEKDLMSDNAVKKIFNSSYCQKIYNSK